MERCIFSFLDPFSVKCLQANKINLSTDTSFSILTELHSQKSNILEKNPLLISLFTYYSLKIKFVTFLISEPATIPCKRKTIKWTTKFLINEKGKGNKESERGRSKQTRKSNLWRMCMREKQKSCFTLCFTLSAMRGFGMCRPSSTPGRYRRFPPR